MVNPVEIPDFQDEAEEALWWDEHPEVVLTLFEQAAEEGTLRRGTLAKRQGNTPTTTIRLDPADILLAKHQAESRGLKYQTYLKMIIHRALLQEATPAGNGSATTSPA